MCNFHALHKKETTEGVSRGTFNVLIEIPMFLVGISPYLFKRRGASNQFSERDIPLDRWINAVARTDSDWFQSHSEMIGQKRMELVNLSDCPVNRL